jgi:hypothetical protein
LAVGIEVIHVDRLAPAYCLENHFFAGFGPKTAETVSEEPIGFGRLQLSIRGELPEVSALNLEKDAGGVAKQTNQNRRCSLFRGSGRKLQKQLLEGFI